jgi:hypothetical protein
LFEDSITKIVERVGGRPQCSDSQDNDGDGTVDLQDPNCTGPNDTSEFGRTLRHRVRVTIKGRFRGRLFSSKRRCETFRLVRLFKVKRGKDKKIGQDQANGQGRWRIRKPNAKGRFYVRVARKEFTQGGNLHICLKGRSGRVRRR